MTMRDEFGEWWRDAVKQYGHMMDAPIMAASKAWQAALATRAKDSDSSIGKWLSAALDDPNVCQEMKTDIEAWFAGGEPNPNAEIALLFRFISWLHGIGVTFPHHCPSETINYFRAYQSQQSSEAIDHD